MRTYHTHCSEPSLRHPGRVIPAAPLQSLPAAAYADDLRSDRVLFVLAAGTLRVDPPGVTPPSALVKGSAPDVMLWLWNRDRQGARTLGEDAAISLLRKVVDAVLDNRVAD